MLSVAMVAALGLGSAVRADDSADANRSAAASVAAKQSVDSSRAATPSLSDEIDRLLAESWQTRDIRPAPTCDDAEFCRRVWLDLAGVAPPVFELRSFLESDDPQKNDKLVRRLVRSPRFASHMASRWIDVLLPSDIRQQPQSQESVVALHRWLRRQFLRNTPYDHLVGGFLTAGGKGDSGPAVFYTSHELRPEKLASATSRIFMGIQLQCAECHDHPFDRWSQESFWQYAAFFAQLAQNDPRPGADVIIEDRPGGEVTLPESDEVMEPRYPGIDQPPERDPTGNRRRQLTIWMASRDNPYFARAAVNRVWGHLFGRGLVDPVDAMDAGNRPSHPELLQALADHFISTRFDLRELYAAIASSDAYRRTSEVSDAARPPEDSFAAMTVKTLSAAQYYDSLQQNVFRRGAVVPGSNAAANRGLREQFLARMRAPDASPRDYPHGVVQALGLMNGPEVSGATDRRQGALLAALDAPFFDDGQRVEALFLATLSRPPRAEESERFREHLATATNSAEKEAAYSDLLWVLLNTAECAVCP